MAGTAEIKVQVRLRRGWLLTNGMWFWNGCAAIAPELTGRLVYWIAENVVIAETRCCGRGWERHRLSL